MGLLTLASVEQLRTHFLLLNGSPEAISVLLDPALTPASFATWIGTAEKPALFEQLMAAPAAVGSVAANVVAMTAVAASSTAMTAVAASSTAMTAVAASSTAMTAVNASQTAKSALYASPLISKFTKSVGWSSPSPQTLRSGVGLLVRVTTTGNSAGWAEGSTSSSQDTISVDGSTSGLLPSARSANPYNHMLNASAPVLPLKRFAASLQVYMYNPAEIAYIALAG